MVLLRQISVASDNSLSDAGLRESEVDDGSDSNLDNMLESGRIHK